MRFFLRGLEVVLGGTRFFGGLSWLATVAGSGVRGSTLLVDDLVQREAERVTRSDMVECRGRRNLS